MSFKDQVVIITGASSGIGYAIAKEISKQGAKVGLLARREEALQQLTQEIREQKGIAEYVPCDISDRFKTLEAIDTLRQKLGPIDLLIANAGVGTTNPLHELNITGSETVIKVNLLGVMYSIEAVLPEMLKRGSGQIAAISSLAAYKGLPGAAAYSASKAAVNAYMEALRIQHYGLGVSFTTVCPGFIHTPMTAKNQGMFWVYHADVAARKILRGIRKRKKVFNFPWITNRLIKLTYWLPDWILNRTMPKDAGGLGA
jgi:short-subunit dehydrogenase